MSYEQHVIIAHAVWHNVRKSTRRQAQQCALIVASSSRVGRHGRQTVHHEKSRVTGKEHQVRGTRALGDVLLWGPT